MAKAKIEYHRNAQGKLLVLRIRSYDSVKHIAIEDVGKRACDHDSLISDCGRCWDCGAKVKR